MADLFLGMMILMLECLGRIMILLFELWKKKWEINIRL